MPELPVPKSSLDPPVPKPTAPPAGIPDVPDMPAEPEVPVPPSQPATPAPKTAADLGPGRDGGGLISIWVPDGARVLINGLETRSTGRHRQYVSYGLRPGAVYRYEIRAQIVRDGRLIEKTRTVYLTRGERSRVAFRFDAEPEEAIATLW